MTTAADGPTAEALPKEPKTSASYDPWGLAPRVERLGELWPWVLGATALGIAALSGSAEAFGLTLGVLAAAQATWGGLRVERGMERIEAVAGRIERGDRFERLSALVEAVTDAYVTVASRGAMMLNPPLQPEVVRESRADVSRARARLREARMRVHDSPMEIHQAEALMGVDLTDAASQEQLMAALSKAWAALSALLSRH